MPADDIPLAVRITYLEHPDGVSDKEMCALYGVSRATVCRWRERIGAYPVGPGRYTIDPSPIDEQYATAVFLRKFGATLEQRWQARGNGHLRTNSDGEH